jgi:hypothetical protein
VYNLAILKKLFKALFWLNNNLLLSLTLLLVIFIPLWPKIPLIQPIPGYIVRIRLEDFLVGLTGLVWFIEVLRKKISLKTPLNLFIALYLVAGFLSILSALFLIKTIPLEAAHIAKAFLHLLRYAEYFSIFFFVYSAITKPQHLKLFLIAFLISVAGVTVYGVGQKFWRWPVYSTMNWEFSSGVPLELVNQQARVQSTFAGHYDFAIYVGLLLPLILVLLYASKNRKERFFIFVVFLMGLWSLIASGLRVAFASYVFSATLVTFLFALQQKTLWKRAQWLTLRLGCVYFITAVFFIVFGNNLFALLSHAVTGVLFPQREVKTIDETIISQYVLPVPKGQSQIKTGEKPQELSGCAKEREISLCIRLESLWPQAITGFLRQPVFGSGYSTLNKRDFQHLSEADGVDNNYLRLLGETGILGFVTFFGIIFSVLGITFKQLQSKENTKIYLAIAYGGIVSGVLINAILIDVFSASKVAFTFLAITGMTLGYWKLKTKKQQKNF